MAVVATPYVLSCYPMPAAATNTPPAAVPTAPKWIGYDYPLQYPIGPLDTVALTLQESTVFSLDPSDPLAEAPWRIMNEHPAGYGRTRLGPEHRLFVVTFYHELHCLRQLQRGLFASDHPEATPHHIQHCFNYLRQNLLCDAADTLERGDFMERDYEVDRVGDTLACRDWSTVFDELDRNFAEWTEWKAEWD